MITSSPVDGNNGFSIAFNIENICIAGMPCHLSLNGYNSSSHSPPHSGSMMLGQDSLVGDSRLLPPGIKSPNTPLHSPSRGHLFLDHQSDNSNDPGVASDQDDDDDHVRDVRIDRGDPREEIRAVEEAEERAPGSPAAPLSLTTNDKDNSADSPKSSNLPEVSDFLPILVSNADKGSLRGIYRRLCRPTRGKFRTLSPLLQSATLALKVMYYIIS